MKRLYILNSPVLDPRLLTSAECANLRAEGISCSPAWLVARDGNGNGGGGCLYSPKPRGGHENAEIYALLV
jgi:hypothetical protein